MIYRVIQATSWLTSEYFLKFLRFADFHCQGSVKEKRSHNLTTEPPQISQLSIAIYFTFRYMDLSIDRNYSEFIAMYKFSTKSDNKNRNPTL